MYIGPSTDDPPIPSPPIKRDTSSAGQFHANAQPTDDTKYNTAINRKLSRRPYFSPGRPPVIAPITVPASAEETVTPRDHSERWNSNFNARVAPEITAVSNPKSNPPSAATIALFSKNPFSFMPPSCNPNSDSHSE